MGYMFECGPTPFILDSENYSRLHMKTCTTKVVPPALVDIKIKHLISISYEAHICMVEVAGVSTKMLLISFIQRVRFSELSNL